MKILGIDSSGIVASAALIDEERLIAEYTINNKKTHSETLLPMIASLLEAVDTDINDVDAVAIAAGPGSFTGLRIGAATAKGLAMAIDKPIIPVPTCEGLAYNLYGNSGLVCPVMDARRNQVYTGIYSFIKTDSEKVESETIMDETAMDINELIEILNEKGESVTFLGDGIPVYKEVIREGMKVPFCFAPLSFSLQKASSVALLGYEYYKKGKAVHVDEFAPIYLRKSQAERESGR